MLKEVQLDKEDFERAEENGFTFEEPIYGIDIAILQHILEQKKDNLGNFYGHKR